MIEIVFTVVILGAIGYVLTQLVRKYDRFSVIHGPEVLTTLGILGCFGGISYALFTLGSNPNDVISNIPSLIGGLKFAFIGSFFGIASSLYLRWVQYKKRNEESSTAISDASNADLLNAINLLRRGLVGDGEDTLITQIKLQRQDSSDNLIKLRQSFDEFATQMVENNQKAIIEALERVIRDFNEKLTEQFGENFKQLNSAVTSLVTWQQQYKDELNQMQAVQQQSASDMKVSADAFAQVVSRASEFANTAEKLKELMSGMDKQKDLLFTQEKALSELLVSMKDVTPQFAEKLNSMLTEIKEGVVQIQSQTQESVKNYTTQVREATGQLTDLLSSVIKDNQRVMLDNLKDNSNVIKEGVVALDKALQEELNKSLQALGQQLAALSEKFVNDYLPLTESLREVVRLAESVRK